MPTDRTKNPAAEEALRRIRDQFYIPRETYRFKATADRDTLARDLLTLSALVGAPLDVLHGLVLVDQIGGKYTLDDVDTDLCWDVGIAHGTAEELADNGWRVDLDAPATAGVLVAVARIARRAPYGQVSPHLTLTDPPWILTKWCWYDNTPESDEPLFGSPTEAEAAARALVAVEPVEVRDA